MSDRAARRHPERHGAVLLRPKRDVAIGYIRPFDVDGRFYDSTFDMLMYDRDHGQHVWGRVAAESGARLAKARNDVAAAFLDTDAEYLYWTDADMVMPPDTVEILREHADPTERPIVCGLYFLGGRTRVTPSIYTLGHGDDGKLESDNILAYPRSALIEIGGTGCGTMLVHRSVFERIRDQVMPPGYPLVWYQDQVIDGKDFGEDLVFCLRARAAGARIWMHTGLKLGHRKMFTMDEDTFLDYAARADAELNASQLTPADALRYEDLPNVNDTRLRMECDDPNWVVVP